MKFQFELMLWIGVGLCLLWLFFGWPPVLQWVAQWAMSFIH